MDEIENLEIGVTDRLAVHKNIALNGRVFCLALVFINVMAGHYPLAVLAALPIGLSCIVDQVPYGKARSAISLAVYAVTAFIALASLVVHW